MVRITDSPAQLLQAFNAVEGDGWYEHLRLRTSDCVAAVKFKYETIRRRSTFMLIDDSTIAVIFGFGCRNRYAVKRTGEVKLQARFAAYPKRATVACARNAGFGIEDDDGEARY